MKDWRCSWVFYGEAANLFVDGQDISSTEEYASGIMATAHFNYREPEQYLFGAFGGYGKVAQADGSDSGSATHYLLGVEGQYHVDDWTFVRAGPL